MSMKQKVFSYALAAVMMMSVAAGCTQNTGGTTSSAAPPSSSAAASPSEAASTAPDAPVSADMRIMWWGSQVRHDGTVAAIKLFEEQNPGISFTTEFMGGGDYFPKLNTLVAAQDVPDVFQIGNNFLTYKAVIEPLDDFVARGLIDLSETSAPFLAPTTIDGQLLGVSLGTNAWTIMYDPEILAAAGVPEPTENWTWSDFEAAVAAVSQKTGGLGTGPIAHFWALNTFVSQYGEDLGMFNKDSTGLGYTDVNMPTEYFSMVKRLMDIDNAYPTVDMVAVYQSDIQSEAIVTGDAAFAFGASNQVMAVATAAGRPIKIVNYPRHTADGLSGAAVRNSQAFSIYNGSPNKDIGAQFINFFVNDLKANRLLGGERGVPIMQTVREDLASNADDITKMVYEYIDTVGKIASHPQPLEPAGQIEFEDMVKRLLEELSLNRITPEQAGENVTSQGSEILTRVR